MIPQVNAEISKVSAGGEVAQWDEDESAGGQKWAGTAPAYYMTKRERISNPTGETDVVMTRYLIVETDVPPVSFEVGDYIDFTTAMSEILTGQILTVEPRKLEGVLSTTRIALELT